MVMANAWARAIEWVWDMDHVGTTAWGRAKIQDGDTASARAKAWAGLRQAPGLPHF